MSVPGSDSVAAPAAAPVPDTVSAPESSAPMTLDACMRYAVEHSPAVRRQDYANRNYRQDYIASVAALVPSVNGAVSASTSFGRSVDPETNTYTDVSNFDNSYSASGQMPLFAGLTGINTVRAAKVMRLQGVEELQLARDEVALRTMEAYFDVVYYTGSVRLAREQLETSAAELAKSRKLLELGLKSAADVAEVEKLIADGKLNDKLAKQTVAGVLAGEGTPDEVVKKHGFQVVSDDGALEKAVDEALAANPDIVEKLKSGNMKPMGAIIGAVMRATRGQADAKAVTKIVMGKIK